MQPEFIALLIGLCSTPRASSPRSCAAASRPCPRARRRRRRRWACRAGQTLRLVIVPQALRVIIPPLTSQYLEPDEELLAGRRHRLPGPGLVFAGTVLNQTGQAIEVIASPWGSTWRSACDLAGHELVQPPHRPDGALSAWAGRRPRDRPAARRSARSAWLRANLFASLEQRHPCPASLWLIPGGAAVPGWAVFDATWSGTAATAARAGACWAFVQQSGSRVHLRSLPRCGALARRSARAARGMALAPLTLRAVRASGGDRLGPVAVPLHCLLLLAGGVLGRRRSQPPLGRADDDGGDRQRRHRRWAIRWRSSSPWAGARHAAGALVLRSAVIEFVRGVPLISVLFMASVMLPLFLPDGSDHRQADARPDR